jgi:hypothetical protein
MFQPKFLGVSVRLIASVANCQDVVRLMIYADEKNVYLFRYARAEDGPCDVDMWFETVADAQAAAGEEFDVSVHDWTEIDDPLEGCQHDWIEPVRITSWEVSETGELSCQRLVNGRWKSFAHRG